MTYQQTNVALSASEIAKGIKKHILLIEDNAEVSKGLLDCADDLIKNMNPKIKIKFSTEFHIEGAIKQLTSDNKQFDGLIVDLMLAKNRRDWDRLQPMIRERREILEQIIEKTDYYTERLSDEIAQLRMRIDDLDNEIDTLVNADGGYEILKEYARYRREERLTLPVIIFTARGLMKIKEKCESIIEPGYFMWFDKPTESKTVVDALFNSWGYLDQINKGNRAINGN